MKLEELLKDYQSLPEYSGLTIGDVHRVSLFGDRPLHVAAARGAMNEIELLLSAGAEVNFRGEHGYTALHGAVEQGHFDAVKRLLEGGADASITNDKGESPEQLASVMGESGIGELIRNWPKSPR